MKAANIRLRSDFFFKIPLVAGERQSDDPSMGKRASYFDHLECFYDTTDEQDDAMNFGLPVCEDTGLKITRGDDISYCQWLVRGLILRPASIAGDGHYRRVGYWFAIFDKQLASEFPVYTPLSVPAKQDPRYTLLDFDEIGVQEDGTVRAVLTLV